MDPEKSINSFEIKKSMGHLIIYGTIFFGNLDTVYIIYIPKIPFLKKN